MLIGIVGTTCSGKTSLADFLSKYHGFQKIIIDDQSRRRSLLYSEDDHQDQSYSECNDAHVLEVPHELTFQTPSQALQYIMLEHRWRKNYVMYPLSLVHQKDLQELRKRPFFLLLSLDAPILLRFKRFKEKFKHTNDSMTLEQFIEHHDQLMFSSSSSSHHAHHQPYQVTDTPSYPPTQIIDANPSSTLQFDQGLGSFLGSVDLQLINPFHILQDFHLYLKKMNIANYERCRPSWDTYFIKLSEWSARRSNCMKRRVGCVLVKNNRIIATGYNGTPRGLRNCNEGGCPRCNDGTAKCGEALDQCFCIHAEENALLEAGRERIESGGGHTTLYCTTCPCIGCAKKIVQAGVREVVYHQSYGMDALTKQLFKSVNVELRQYQGVLEIEDQLERILKIY